MADNPQLILWPYGPKGFTFPDEIFLDTSYLLAAMDRNDRRHNSAKILHADLIAQQRSRAEAGQAPIRLCVSPYTMSEMWWIYLRKVVDFVALGFSSLQEMFKQDPVSLASHMPSLVKMDAAARTLEGLQIVPIPVETCDRALAFVTGYTLAPADAFHIATAEAHGIRTAITGDQDWVRPLGVFDLVIRY